MKVHHLSSERRTDREVCLPFVGLDPQVFLLPLCVTFPSGLYRNNTSSLRKNKLVHVSENVHLIKVDFFQDLSDLRR